MVKLRILIWEDYPGLSAWVQCNHKSLRKKDVGESESQRGDARKGANIRGREDATEPALKRRKPRNVSSP